MELLKTAILLELVFLPIALSLMQLSHKLAYTEELNDETYGPFVNTNGLGVVYFFKTDDHGLPNFFKELEKSAAIMTIYDSKFAVVDCNVHKMVGHCEEKGSEDNVYMFKSGQMVLNVSLNSMFDVNSIISNVLQVVLLHQVPILQSIEEKERLLIENHGVSDVIFSYQRALGTYSHRILMEAIFVFQNTYHCGLTNEQNTVENLPHYSSSDMGAVWLFRCKSVTAPDQPCPVFKYRGQMERSALAKFFRVLELPFAHDIGEDGDFDPYQESEVDVIYIFYDGKTESATRDIITEFSTNYTGLMGIITINIEVVDPAKYNLDRSLKLPLLAFKHPGEANLMFTDGEMTPAEFVQKQLKITHLDTKSEKMEMEKEEDEEMNQRKNDLELERQIEIQDDRVAQAVFDMRGLPLDRTHLPALTDKTFFPETNDRPILMVLFYLSFDARNQIVLRIFAKAAELLAEENLFPLAAVECYDWTDVCAKVGISVYPTVRVYRADMEPVSYDGPLSVASVVAAVKLHTVGAPVMISSLEDLGMFILGGFPEGIMGVTDVTIIGAFGPNDKHHKEVFKMAAKKLQGRFVCGLVAYDVAEQAFQSIEVSIPLIQVMNRGHVNPLHSLQMEDSVDDLVQSILLATLPILPELKAENFPVYFSMKKPFVILFVPSTGGKLFHLISSLTADRMVEHLIVAWMSTSPTESGKPSAGEQVLRHYVNEPKQEELLFIDHETGKVHQFNENDISRKTVESWLNGIRSGDIMTSMRLSEHTWKPRLPGYNFLKKMDEEAANKVPEDRDRGFMREINEHGLGYYDDMAHSTSAMDQQDLEDEIQAELEQLKHSRLYQDRRPRPISKSKSMTDEEMKASEKGMTKEMDNKKMLESHSEL